MDHLQMEKLEIEIKELEHLLLKKNTVFNIYQKINYFKDNYQTNSVINLWISRDKEIPYISLLSTNSNNGIVLGSEELKKFINIDFPPESLLNFTEDTIAFSNNSKGFESLINIIFKENNAYFKSLCLDILLDEKPYIKKTSMKL